MQFRIVKVQNLSYKKVYAVHKLEEFRSSQATGFHYIKYLQLWVWD